jgi:hypothetical protein
MNKQNQGFIFLVTLIITGILSALALTSLQQVLLYYKAMNKQEEVRQNFNQLEAIALKLAEKNELNQECIIKKDEANYALNKLVHREGCPLKQGKNNYQYVIEDLGIIPCLVVYVQGLKYPSYHRRVSLMKIENKNSGSFLQIRLITPGKNMPCLEEERLVTAGVSSWRFLAG